MGALNTVVDGAVLVAVYLLYQIPPVYASWLWAKRFTPGNWFEFLTAVGLIWFMLMTAIPGVLGLVGVLTPTVLFGAGLAVGAMALVSERKRPALELPPLRLAASECLMVALTLGFVSCQWRTFSMLPAVGTDALTYHLYYPAVWLTTGKVARITQPGLMTATYPCYGELIYAWNIAPLMSDFFAKNFQFCSLLLAWCGGIAAGIAAGFRRNTAMAAAMLMVFCGVVFRNAAVANTDLMTGADVLVGAACLTVAARRRSTGYFLLAGVAFGMAAGTKYLGFMLAPVAFLLMAGTLWSLRRDCRKGLLWSTLAAVVAGCPCFIANFITYGNPLFPTRIGFGPFMTETSRPVGWRWSAWSYFVDGGQNSVALGTAVILLVSLCGAGLVPLLLQGRRARPARLVLWCLASSTGVLLAIQLATYPSVTQPRQIIPLAMLMAMAAIGVFSLIGRARCGDWLVAGSAVVLAWGASRAQMDYLEYGFSVLQNSLLAFLLAAVVTHCRRKVALVAIAAVSLLLIGRFGWSMGVANFCGSQVRSTFLSREDEAARQTIREETRGQGAVIAYAGLFSYHYLGQNYENRVLFIPVTPSGRVELDAYRSFAEMRSPCIYAAYLTRLRKAGVRYLIADPRVLDIPNRSLELEWALAHPEHFMLRMAAPGYGFFELRPDASTYRPAGCTSPRR